MIFCRFFFSTLQIQDQTWPTAPVPTASITQGIFALILGNVVVYAKVWASKRV